MAIVACGIPGEEGQPAPTLGPFAIETAVAGTAEAAAQQTQQANPSTATATVPATATITPTPKISLSGTSLVVQADQSTLFTDHTAGFRLVIPAGWLATRINEEEYWRAFTLEVVVANPPISERLSHMQTNNPQYFRLNAIDIREGHVVNGVISDITVICQPQEDQPRSLEEWQKLEKRRVVSRPIMEGEKLLYSGFQQTTNGTRVLVVEESWDATVGGKIFYRRVFFSLPSGVISVDFQTYLEFKEVVLPDFEQVVNSLTSLAP